MSARDRVSRWVSRKGAVELLPAMALTVGLLANVVFLASLARGLWFFGDDWDFLLRRGVVGEHERSIWLPHNEHWSTVPILVFRFLFGIFGIAHYLPYALMPIAAHAVTWGLVYLAVRRAGVMPWPACLAVLVGAFLSSGAGAENALWDFQIGFLGAAVFGVAAVVITQRDSRWMIPAAWVALVLSLMSAGVGLVFLGWTGLHVLLRRGLAMALAVASVPALTYAVWFALVGHQVGESIPKDVAQTPFRQVEGLVAVWSVALQMPGAGPVMMVVIAGVLLRRSLPAPAFALAASGAGAYLAAFLLFGYSRSGLGEGAGSASRYLYFGIVFTLPALAMAANLAAAHLRPRPFARPIAFLSVVVLLVPLGMAQADRYADRRRAITDPLAPTLAGAQWLVADGQRLLNEQPDPVYNPDITVKLLGEAGVADALRGYPSAPLRAAGRLQVLVGATRPDGLKAPSDVVWNGLQAMGPEANGCMTRHAPSASLSIDVPVPAEGTSFRLMMPRASDVQTMLVQGKRHSPPALWRASTSNVWVSSVAGGATLRVFLPEGDITVCAH